MGLYESVKNIAEKNRNNQILLILHTSCILESERYLRKLLSIENLSVTVPNGVFLELKLLTASSNKKFSKNAELIIKELCSNRKLKYDIEQFYKNCVSFTDIADINGGITIFGFYDHSVAEEFIKNFYSRSKKRIYVFSFDPYGYNNDFDKDVPIVYYNKLSNSEEANLCKCVPIVCSRPLQTEPTEDRRLYIVEDNKFPINKNYIYGSEMKLLAGGIGGEAKVYLSQKHPGKVIKCYTKVLPSKAKTDKLIDLIILGKKIKMPSVSMPTALIYNEEKQCVGFMMPELSGCSLSSIYFNELWDRYNRDSIIKQLALLLLELRLYRINVVDLSGNNVRVSENGRVYIIDCDSFETFRFPGSGYTPPYGSPDLDKKKLDMVLRQPHQNNFEFAVLLFQCLLGWENPLTQKNMGDDTPEWGVYQFPYECNENLNAPNSKFERWMELNENVRKAFADEFHFRRYHTIGSWLKVLQII